MVERDESAFAGVSGDREKMAGTEPDDMWLNGAVR